MAVRRRRRAVLVAQIRQQGKLNAGAHAMHLLEIALLSLRCTSKGRGVQAKAEEIMKAYRIERTKS
jgi:hypothetical protein